MKATLGFAEHTSAFAVELVKVFKDLAIKGGKIAVLTEVSYIPKKTKIFVIDEYHDEHSLIVEASLEWVKENWGEYLPEWVENDTGDEDWTPWYD